jgi:serine/threonine-protein kinase
VTDGEDDGPGFGELLARLAAAPPVGVSPVDALPAGTRVGPYRVEAVLARGGMAVVHRARDVRLDREVALKVLTRWTGPTAAEAALAEARAVAAAGSHPSLPVVHDVGVHDGRGWIALEHLDGETFERRSARGLDAGTVWEVARSVAAALEHLHARGLVHGDVSASNVVLEPGRVVLIDLGLTQATAATGPPGIPMGTPGYVAPERLGARAPASPRSDVYAFGTLLGVGLAATRTPPRALAALRRRCQAQEPSARPADGAALVADLERGWRRRRTGRLAWAGALVLALVGAAALWGGGRPPGHADRVQAGRWTPVTRRSEEATLLAMRVAPGRDQLALVDARGLAIAPLGGARRDEARWVAPGHAVPCVTWLGSSREIVLGAPGRLERIERGAGNGYKPRGPWGGGRAGCPTASPDGRHVAWVSEGGLALERLGAASTPIPVNLGVEARLPLEVAWHPAGAELAALVSFGPPTRPRVALLRVGFEDGLDRVRVRRLAVDDAFRSTEGLLALAYTRDGASLLVARRGAPGESVVLESSRGSWAPREVASADRSIGALGVAADGALLALLSRRQAEVALLEVGEDLSLVSEPDNLTRSLDQERVSAWTLDGRAVWIHRHGAGSHRPPEAVVLSLDGMAPTPALAPPHALWPTPALQAGREGLAYWTLDGSGGLAPAHLWWHDPDATAPRHLFTTPEPVPVSPNAGRPPPWAWAVRCDRGRCLLARSTPGPAVAPLPSGSSPPRWTTLEGEASMLAAPAVHFEADGTVALALASSAHRGIARYRWEPGAEADRALARSSLAPSDVHALPDGCFAQQVAFVPGRRGALLATAVCPEEGPYRLFTAAPARVPREVWRSGGTWVGELASDPVRAGRVAATLVGFEANVYRLPAP